MIPLVSAAQQQPGKVTSSYAPVDISQDFQSLTAPLRAAKAEVEKRQADLLNTRYDLVDRPAKGVTMSRGKPVQDGVRVKLPSGVTWDTLATMSPAEIRQKGVFPMGFRPLPHVKQQVGGMVFPKFEIDEIKKQEGRDLTRFDIDFDIPDQFLPEFPPPMYLTTRPDLGDVSKGQLVTIENYYELFNGNLNPKQIEGLRLLLTPFPQQQFNQTEDRRSERPSRGVACFDCHTNGHTNAAFHLAGDTRPQEFRHRIETVSLRGVNIQRIFGSQRALKTVEDFTEFEQRAAYFDGDPVIATKKGVNILDRGARSIHGRDPGDARLPARAEARHGRQARSGAGDRDRAARPGDVLRKGEVRECHPAPNYTDDTMHDLQLERFYSAHDQRNHGQRRRADQDLHVAWHQGFAAVPSRRPAADAGRHGRVLQSLIPESSSPPLRRATSSPSCSSSDPLAPVAGRC